MIHFRELATLLAVEKNIAIKIYLPPLPLQRKVVPHERPAKKENRWVGWLDGPGRPQKPLPG